MNLRLKEDNQLIKLEFKFRHSSFNHLVTRQCLIYTSAIQIAIIRFPRSLFLSHLNVLLTVYRVTGTARQCLVDIVVSWPPSEGLHYTNLSLF